METNDEKSLDYAGYLEAKEIKEQTLLHGSPRIDVAMISELRYFLPGDEKGDCRKFGYNHEKFDVLDWIQYRLDTHFGPIFGQLFMIGIKSCDVPRQIKLAQKLFVQAVDRAVAKGAKVILLAANTKSIFGRGDTARERLAKLYPGIVFTLGDNLTAAFINETIEKATEKNRLDREEANTLIVAPRGLLGRSSAHFVTQGLRFTNVWGLFNPNDGIAVASHNAEEIGIRPAVSFSDLAGKIDMVVACGAQSYYELTPSVIKLIKRPKSHLIVVDPCEPANVREETLSAMDHQLLYYKAGNGYNLKLKYILGKQAARVLGMEENLFWGCFSETFVLAHALARDPSLKDQDWFAVVPEKIELMKRWAHVLGFRLPPSKNL